MDFVYPRDFFNYANILKCWGYLTLWLQDSPQDNVEILCSDEGEQPCVCVDPNTGDTRIDNYWLDIGGVEITPYIPLNSRNKNPMYVDFAGNTIKVIGADGKPTAEFINLITPLPF